MSEVSSQLQQLSPAQARVLALYSYGMAMTRQCGQTVVGMFLALVLELPFVNLRQRLREWNYEVEAKRGKQRRALDVQAQFGGLLRFILGHWTDPKRLVLVLDVTYLRDRHTILAVSVVYRGCAIPVAWRVLPGEAAGEWHPLWVQLLSTLHPAVPPRCQVWVLGDAGLYSKRLFEVIRQLAWHPVLRIGTQGLYRRPQSRRWRSLTTLAERGMKSRSLRVICFKSDPLPCTLWVQWPTRYDDPCLLVTDLTPKQVDGNPYALRAWIEAGFKDLKRGGLHWEQLKTTAPARMERLLLVMALALFWLVRQGSLLADELALDAAALPLSCATLGWLALLVAAIHHRPLKTPVLAPLLFPPLSP